jgi:hypothetical protein
MPQIKWLVTSFPSRWPVFDLRSGHVGFVVDKVALGHILSTLVSSTILIPLTAPLTSSSIIRGWCNRPNSGWVPSWFSLTPPQKIMIKKITCRQQHCLMDIDGTSSLVSWHKCYRLSGTFEVHSVYIQRNHGFKTVFPKGYNVQE